MLSTVLSRPSPSIAAESLRRNRSQPRARVAASGLGLGCVKTRRRAGAREQMFGKTALRCVNIRTGV